MDGQSGQKNDTFDARRLGQLARGGYIKEIHHPMGNRRRFRELVLSYRDTVKRETRIKNKLNAQFRQNGIRCNGETVYLGKHWEGWKKKLAKDKVVHFVAEGLWSQLDKIQEVKEGKEIRKETHRFGQPIVLKLARQKSVSDGTRKRESIRSEVACNVLLFAEYAPSQFPQIFIGVRDSERCVR